MFPSRALTKRNMAKLLFVVQQYAPEIGGLATSGTRISGALAGLGHEIHVVALSSELDSGEAESQQTASNLFVHRFGRSKQIDFTLQQLSIFYQWLHEKHRFDAVWGHYAWQMGFSAIWFAKTNELPSVLSLRGNDVDRQLFPPGDFSRLSWMLENATELVSVSKDLAEKVKTINGRSATVLYNAVDSKLFCPSDGPSWDARRVELRKELGVAPEELLLVFSGELRAKKGLPILIETFRQISAKRPARLLILGGVRDKEKAEFKRCTAGVPTEMLIRTGHIADAAKVADYLRAGDLFLLPSLWEGLPNSLLEAMAVGIPVIASDAGAISEVMVNGKLGVVIPRSQLHMMADRADRFLARPAVERNAMTDAARNLIVEEFSPEIERKRLAEILARVVG